jgi:hypothetical protein
MKSWFMERAIDAVACIFVAVVIAYTLAESFAFLQWLAVYGWMAP